MPDGSIHPTPLPLLTRPVRLRRRQSPAGRALPPCLDAVALSYARRGRPTALELFADVGARGVVVMRTTRRPTVTVVSPGDVFLQVASSPNGALERRMCLRAAVFVAACRVLYPSGWSRSAAAANDLWDELEGAALTVLGLPRRSEPHEVDSWARFESVGRALRGEGDLPADMVAAIALVPPTSGEAA